MSLKILHTSDIHLGMKFAGYPEVQSQLSEARYETLSRLVETANDENCDMFVITGDLFDRPSVAKKEILKAAQILKEFSGRLIVVLPGNHDFISEDKTDIWGYFKQNAGDNLLLLESKRVYPLRHYELDVNIYPAPCDAKHSSVNYVGWIKDAEKDKAVKYHIGVAHGSLEGFSPDFDKRFYPISESELIECRLDLWLMGHTHIHYPDKPDQGDKIYFPSTPEPDGFDCMHEGRAWILEIDEDKKIKPRLLTTGKYRFLCDDANVNETSDIERIKTKYSSNDYSGTLLRLKLRGRLSKDDYNDLVNLKDFLEKKLLYLQFDSSEVAEKITPDDINRTFTEGSFPYKLLTQLAEENDFEALQIAYDLMLEQKR